MIKVPHRSAVELMSIELGLVSDLQTAEIAMVTEHQHVCGSVDHLARVHSDFHGVHYDECRRTIISNISNTLTDRVAANHAAIAKLEEMWGKHLNELNCHLHPLDTIATSCRSALKSLEEIKGQLYGKDCIAGNIVLQMNKFRYKDGKGDPKGFTTFLDDKKLPRGILPRYRGNRLHILFHICGKLMEHHPLFLEFLTTGNCKCGGLQAALLSDFPTILPKWRCRCWD